MVLHGSEGAWSGWSHRRTAILAAHGFVAFPFGYAKGGNTWNAGGIVDAALGPTAEALVIMGAQEFIGPKIGIYGSSRGAEHALLLVSLMARDRDLISEVAGGLVAGEITHSQDKLALKLNRSCVIGPLHDDPGCIEIGEDECVRSALARVFLRAYPLRILVSCGQGPGD